MSGATPSSLESARTPMGCCALRSAPTTRSPSSARRAAVCRPSRGLRRRRRPARASREAARRGRAGRLRGRSSRERSATSANEALRMASTSRCDELLGQRGELSLERGAWASDDITGSTAVVLGLDEAEGRSLQASLQNPHVHVRLEGESPTHAPPPLLAPTTSRRPDADRGLGARSRARPCAPSTSTRSSACSPRPPARRAASGSTGRRRSRASAGSASCRSWASASATSRRSCASGSARAARPDAMKRMREVYARQLEETRAPARAASRRSSTSSRPASQYLDTCDVCDPQRLSSAVRVLRSARQGDRTCPSSCSASALTEGITHGLKLPIFMDNHSTTPVDPRVARGDAAVLHDEVRQRREPQPPVRLGGGRGGRPRARAHRARSSAPRTARKSSSRAARPRATTSRIKGVAEFYKDKGNHIITTVTEHKAVLDTCKRLEKEGYEVTYLGVAQGRPRRPGRRAQGHHRQDDPRQRDARQQRDRHGAAHRGDRQDHARARRAAPLGRGAGHRQGRLRRPEG